ncbi:MAG: hypothetical protein ACRC1T_12060 [Clostridium chrysemydis]|uniref:hypothetical protein n=1 Tax=Clostridium chrysemydis TaxID=2665504 RepID=UPI003F2DB0D9
MNKFKVIKNGISEEIVLNNIKIHGVKGYSINKKADEISEITITFDCSNVEVIEHNNSQIEELGNSLKDIVIFMKENNLTAEISSKDIKNAIKLMERGGTN